MVKPPLPPLRVEAERHPRQHLFILVLTTYWRVTLPAAPAFRPASCLIGEAGARGPPDGGLVPSCW